MLTEVDRRNGWTEASLAAYLEEREIERAEAGLTEMVPGNVVTEYQRPRPAIRISNSWGFDPHGW